MLNPKFSFSMDKYPYYQINFKMEWFHRLTRLIQLMGGVAGINNGEYRPLSLSANIRRNGNGSLLSWLFSGTRDCIAYGCVL